MTSYVVVKIGSQSLINQQCQPDVTKMEYIIRQIMLLNKSGHRVILVSSGAVAVGRGLASSLSFSDTIQERQVLSSLGQAKLIQTYNNILARYEGIAAQILLTKDDFRLRSHYLNMARAIQGLLLYPNLLPIVNENDTTSIQELMFTDNDELSTLVAAMIGASRLVILTSTEGVYDRDPHEKGAQLIQHLNTDHLEDWPHLSESKTRYGRGGMASKLISARRAVKLGIKTHIACAATPDVLLRLILHDEQNLGTTITGSANTRGVKKWLAFAPATGAGVIINRCVLEIIQSRQKAVSLLPVGIVAFEGRFSKGDIVQIKDEEGRVLGLGLAEYSSIDLNSKLGQKNEPIFMHYDKMVIKE